MTPDRRHAALLRDGRSLAATIRRQTRRLKADARGSNADDWFRRLAAASSGLAELGGQVAATVGERVPAMIDKAGKGLGGFVGGLFDTVRGWFSNLVQWGQVWLRRAALAVVGGATALPDPLEAFDRVANKAEEVSRDSAVYIHTGAAWGIADTPGVIGYTVMSQSDNRVRPEHWERHGRAYYRDPKAGQLSYEFLPRPPFESPAERFRRAWGCRCYLVPIIAGDRLEV